jgi:hypothetical protein
MTGKLNTVLLRIGWAAWTLFGLLLATDVGLLPTRLAPKVLLFRWQPWLMLGILVILSRDLLASWHCRACKRRDHLVIKGLFTMGGLLCPSCFERRLRCTTADLGLRTAPIKSRLESSAPTESAWDRGIFRRDRRSEPEPSRVGGSRAAADDNAIAGAAKHGQLKLLLQAQMRRSPQWDAATSTGARLDGSNGTGDLPEERRGGTAVRHRGVNAKEAALIEMTLQRINEGSYGICPRCAQPIPPKHLQAVPWAECCLECQHAAAA